jgi:MoaA/NifB/PqqE/SkfB family radical SAM enzyme
MKSINFMKLAMSALESNFVRLSKPYKLNFSVTYNCNSHCLTCNIWNMKPKGELTIEEIREFAKKNTSFKWLTITGGEPFLRSDITEVVKAFCDTSRDLYLVTIPTNSLTNPDLIMRKVEEILKLGIPQLTITLSLDGYREVHDRIRGTPGNFDKVMEMAKRLNALKERYGNLAFAFGYTMSVYNQGALQKTIEEVMRIVPEVSYNDFHVNASQVSEIYYRNEGKEIHGERDGMVRELNWLLSKRSAGLGPFSIIESAFLRNLVKYMVTGKTPIASKSLDVSLFLDSFGNVYPSIMWGRKIGNVRETGYDLAPLWDNEDAQDVRRMIKEGKEPGAWTSCEAYQALVGNALSLLH